MQSALSSWASSEPGTSALVWRLGPEGPTRVAAHRPGVPRIPASNMKLVTSAGALLELGPDHRFRTRLLAGPRTERRGGGLVGPVYVRGSGDPVLATGAYARRYLPGGRSTSIADLVRPLRRAGVRQLVGPIVADSGIFDSRRLGPGWPSRYRAYSQPLSGLPTNQNFAGNRRASRVGRPDLAAARRVRAAVRGFRIGHRGGLGSGPTPPGSTVLATAVSPTLAVILRELNPASDNFVAETLMKAVGASRTGRGTTRAGTTRTAALLRERGILGSRDRLIDGSGLSRANRLSATTLVRLVAAADADRSWGRPLFQSLARGGQGTLVRRLRHPVARNRVRAKTGYLSGVSALSGRVVSRGGERYAFSMLMRTSDISGARAAQDRVVRLLAAGAEDPGRRRSTGARSPLADALGPWRARPRAVPDGHRLVRTGPANPVGRGGWLAVPTG